MNGYETPGDIEVIVRRNENLDAAEMLSTRLEALRLLMPQAANAGELTELLRLTFEQVSQFTSAVSGLVPQLADYRAELLDWTKEALAEETGFWANLFGKTKEQRLEEFHDRLAISDVLYAARLAPVQDLAAIQAQLFRDTIAPLVQTVLHGVLASPSPLTTSQALGLLDVHPEALRNVQVTQGRSTRHGGTL